MSIELNDSQFKGYLVNLLQNGAVEVNFTKVDGSSRKMNCTLKESALPGVVEVTTQRAENQDTLRVFDTDIGEWRSFRLDLVNSVFKDGEQIWSNS